MRAKEIMEDSTAATTSSGAMAVVAQPLGSTQLRIPAATKTTKYSNRPAPNYASPKRNSNVS
jgi:hypothetical protein